MNKEIHLDTRLQMVASFVRKYSVVADIGTDHAYLPIFLVNKGVCKKAIACDIRKGPLDSAMHNIRLYKQTDAIECRLGNGLQPICEKEVQDVVIAGMGGENIRDILSECQWIKDKKIRLILQPMTHAEVVRKFLYENNFSILHEQTTMDERHVYVVIVAEFFGKKITESEEDCVLGMVGIERPTESDYKYIEKIQNRYRKIQNGISNEDSEQIDYVNDIIHSCEKRLQSIKERI